MGLDVTFYHSMKPAAAPEGTECLQEWAEENEAIWISPGEVELQGLHFPHIPKLTEGVFHVTAAETDLPSRAYSSYNRWRDDLARYAGYGSAEKAWRDYSKGPFYELIHFSDCEGFILDPAIGKLYQDFLDNRGRIFDLVPEGIEGDRFKSYYQDWVEGLREVANKDGLVYFS